MSASSSTAPLVFGLVVLDLQKRELIRKRMKKIQASMDEDKAEAEEAPSKSSRKSAASEAR